MTRTFTKSDAGDTITYSATEGITITVYKTGDGSLHYTVDVDISDGNDPLHQPWGDFVTNLEQENTIQ